MATKLSAIMDHASPQHLVFRGADCFLMAAMRSAFFLGSGSVMVTPASGRDWAPCGCPAWVGQRYRTDDSREPLENLAERGGFEPPVEL